MLQLKNKTFPLTIAICIPSQSLAMLCYSIVNNVVFLKQTLIFIPEECPDS